MMHHQEHLLDDALRLVLAPALVEGDVGDDAGVAVVLLQAPCTGVTGSRQPAWRLVLDVS